MVSDVYNGYTENTVSRVDLPQSFAVRVRAPAVTFRTSCSALSSDGAIREKLQSPSPPRQQSKPKIRISARMRRRRRRVEMRRKKSGGARAQNEQSG